MNSCAFTLPAPAKLNLFLHIVGRRDDGYHLLQSVFTFLDHSDLISFRPHDTLTLINTDATPAEQNNLIYQAAQLLQHHTGSQQGALIRLEKRLAVGGGLGGGSSDAATCLLGLNHLWQLGLSLDELAQLGLQLGADIPVFVRGQTAFAEGVGDILTPINLPESYYFVLDPHVQVSTQQIFTYPSLVRNQPPLTVENYLQAPESDQWSNICEAASRELYPTVGDAIDWLKDQAGNSRMTGTGACVFAHINSISEGERIKSCLPAGWSGFVTHNHQVSPLHLALARLEKS